MGAKSRGKGYFNVKACIGLRCANRDKACHRCVRVQGKMSEFVPTGGGGCADKDISIDKGPRSVHASS